MSTKTKGKKIVSAAINGMLKALDMRRKPKSNDWRSVSVYNGRGDRVAKLGPDNCRAVLCLTRSGNQQIGYFVSDTEKPSRWISVSGDIIDVTHWREL